MFFKGIRTAATAYQRIPEPQDPTVNSAVSFLRALRSSEEGIGFFGRDRSIDATDVAIRILQEHGHNLEHDQTIKVIEHLHKIDEAQAIKRRFFVQIVISAAAFAIAIAIIFALIPTNEELNKVGYGLIGTVVGYWLR